MKIGVMMCAYHEESKIQSAIRQFDGFDFETVVAVSKSPWFGEGKPDKTAQLALEAGATVKLFDWQDEKDQKNWIMNKLQDRDWIIMSAPDMYMTKESITNLLYSINGSKERAHACLMKTYWKNTDTVLVLDEKNSNETFNTVAIRPSEIFEYSARFKNYAYFKLAEGVTVHHLSWVKTDGEMKNKISTWSHAPEVVSNWYEKYWMGNEYPIVHVNIEDKFYTTSKYSLPKEIIDLLDKDWLRKAEK